MTLKIQHHSLANDCGRLYRVIENWRNSLRGHVWGFCGSTKKKSLLLKAEILAKSKIVSPATMLFKIVRLININ